jgi:hypothetical protein
MLAFQHPEDESPLDQGGVMRPFALILAIAMTMTSPAMAQQLAVGSGQFERDEAAGATVERQRVFYHRPAAWTPAGRIVVVMHGVNRDADRYRDEWRGLADQYGFLLVVPEFSQAKFPGDAGYNFGGMVDDKDKPLPRERWSFNVVDRVFADVRRLSGAERQAYSLYGHSAGAQFAHRFLLFAASPSVEMVVVANAGWYTLPVADEAFPYGLKGSPATEADVRAFLARPLVLQLGEADTDSAHSSLRRTPARTASPAARTSWPWPRSKPNGWASRWPGGWSPCRASATRTARWPSMPHASCFAD